MAGITTPQTLKIKGNIKKKKVQEVRYQEEKYQETSKEKDTHQEPTLEKEEMNLTISCNALVGITTPQAIQDIQGIEFLPISSTRVSSDGCKWRNHKFL